MNQKKSKKRPGKAHIKKTIGTWFVEVPSQDFVVNLQIKSPSCVEIVKYIQVYYFK